MRGSAASEQTVRAVHGERYASSQQATEYA